MTSLFNDIYRGKKILITGHTGFKGSWLALWLLQLGADVVGYSLEAPSEPNHFGLLQLKLTSITGDVLNKEKLLETIETHKPDAVFHLAAQALVRDSYADPVNTFETNIMGAVNVLESCRKTKSVKAIVNVTSDKCYDNTGSFWGYRETDPMGGDDPYSASKGAVELVANSYRTSFFSNEQYGTAHSTLLANVRAGNVIGGGDWAKDRLIPDIMRSTQKKETVIIRNPKSTRPWQHVLEPLSGYLHVGWKLLEKQPEFAENWNFGPSDEASLTVIEVLESIKKHIPELTYEIKENPNDVHEAHLLRLDSSKARLKLKWKNIWGSDTTFEKTAEWYTNYYQDGKTTSVKDLDEYIRDAKLSGVEWAK